MTWLLVEAKAEPIFFISVQHVVHWVQRLKYFIF
jgi:hypothetical protein